MTEINIEIKKKKEEVLELSMENTIKQPSETKEPYKVNKIDTTEANIKQESLFIFMLMPFEEKLTQIYERYIKKPLESRGHEVKKSDDFFKPTPILEDILDSISKADIIIAELTRRNPNVFYELGRAHEKKKYVIQICQKEEDIPFDLRPIRTIIYADTPKGYDYLKNQLLNYIKGYNKEK